MPIILLVRHGENEFVKTGRLAGQQPGVHLNEKGREQAQSVAIRLNKAPIKAIYSSPLERAMETAEPLAKILELPIIQRAGLIETDCGEWQNQKVKALSRLKKWKIVQSNPSTFRFPGGESIREVHARVTAELSALSERYDSTDVVACFSHADPIKLAVAYFIGLPLDLFQRLTIAPGSVTALALTESGSRLLTLNVEADLWASKL
jgi:probable phosphomutase (TIGR03848 family)